MEEKRRSQRYAVTLPGSYTCEGSEPDTQCIIVELSHGGLRLKSKEKIPFGSTVTVGIACPALPKPASFTVTVRWSKQMYDDPEFEYLAGGEFAAIDENVREQLISHAHTI